VGDSIMRVIKDLLVGDANVELRGLVAFKDLVLFNNRVPKIYNPLQRFSIYIVDETNDVFIRTTEAESTSVPIMAFRKTVTN